MPQILLPLFPAGVTEINDKLAFKNEDGVVTYFNATMPLFQHAEDDIQSFKMIVSQFYVMGVAKQAEIVAAFGVNSLLIKRSVKLYREKGAKGFFAPKQSRGPGVLTEPALKETQSLLDAGMTPGDISQQLGLKADTIRKAIIHGRLHRPPVSSNNGNGREASSKSERSGEDGDAGMGVAATNVVDRLAASVGLSGVMKV